MILGGNQETGYLVDVARGMGYRTIVADPNPNAPAKLSADLAYTVDATDISALSDIISTERVDGIVLGVADPLVRAYFEVCSKAGYPCYVTPRSADAFSSKLRFESVCEAFGISTIPRYSPELLGTPPSGADLFPVLVKPSDGAAGVGISICRDAGQLASTMSAANTITPNREWLIQRYMDCDDLFAYYTFVNGQAYLSAIADRFTSRKQKSGSPVCVGAAYPSKYLERFLIEIDPKLVRMFKELGIQDGVLLIQFFADDMGFYAYDPGFRLQGEAPHIILRQINKFDHREMLIHYSVTGVMCQENFGELNDPRLRGKAAATIWVLLRAGTIGAINGLESLANHPMVVNCLQRFKVGDVIQEHMLGTERQVFSRIYVVAPSKNDLAEVISFSRKNLQVLDSAGDNMILDMLNPEHILKGSKV